MIFGRLHHAPRACLGVLALEVLQNHFGEFDMLSAPLSLRQNQPIQRAFQASLERVTKKRLSVANKPDFAGRQSQLLPQEPHQAVALCAAAGVAMSARGEDQSSRLLSARACNPIRKTMHQQRMSRIYIIVMQSNLWIRASRFTERAAEAFALQQIQIQCGRKDEDLVRALFGFLCDRFGQGVDCGQTHDGLKSENLFTGFGHGPRLLAGLIPRSVPALQIRSEDERRCQCSFPPIRPCLVIVASTSTMARTATSAVMSEMS
jgi:hypothetical protein